MFLSFEGIDGSGKSTQVARLAADLRELGREVIVGREPGGTPIGDQIRAILHHIENNAMDAHAEFLLYSASRAQLVAEIVRPALARGAIVILDRYIDSTFAYQGYGRGLDLAVLRQITAFATGALQPDCTFYLDLDVTEALARRKSAAAQGAEWTRLDAEALAFHERVRAGYEQLITADPSRFIRIDATASADHIHTAIRAALSERLSFSASRILFSNKQ